MAQANAAMDSVFMRKISEGRIRNLLQLKSAYRSLVMKTHPDAVGSDRLTDTFVRLSSEYEEAKTFLESRAPFRQSPALPRTKNNRLAFYQALQRLQSLTLRTVSIDQTISRRSQNPSTVPGSISGNETALMTGCIGRLNTNTTGSRQKSRAEPACSMPWL